jgi:hypothetical protein
MMRLWCWRTGGSFVVCRGDIRAQVARVLLANDFQVRQRKKKRLADAQGSSAGAIGIILIIVVVLLLTGRL